MPRPKGAVNETTKQIQHFCRSVISDPAYRESFIQRARSGNLGPMEAVMWAYGYGKPKESVDVHVLHSIDDTDDLTECSTEELQLRLKRLTEKLEEAASIEASIPAEYRVAPLAAGSSLLEPESELQSETQS
jgi:hypothetical protein